MFAAINEQECNNDSESMWQTDVLPQIKQQANGTRRDRLTCQVKPLCHDFSAPEDLMEDPQVFSSLGVIPMGELQRFSHHLQSESGNELGPIHP